MGLDMSLEANVYIGGYYDSREVEGSVELSIKGEKVNIEVTTLTSVCLHIGYWRKANAIHNWFVNNIQNGIDECIDSNASMEELLELKILCEKVLENNNLAKELLPSSNGFFFGSTEYDSGYFEDLKYTVSIINKAEQMTKEFPSNTYPNFKYSSSW